MSRPLSILIASLAIVGGTSCGGSSFVVHGAAYGVIKVEPLAEFPKGLFLHLLGGGCTRAKDGYRLVSVGAKPRHDTTATLDLKDRVAVVTAEGKSFSVADGFINAALLINSPGTQRAQCGRRLHIWLRGHRTRSLRPRSRP